MHGAIPGEAQNLIVTYLKTLVSAGSAKLGINLIVSVLVALWSARAGTVSLIQALKREKRSLIRLEAVALGITVSAILFVIVVLVLIATIPAALHLSKF